MELFFLMVLLKLTVFNMIDPNLILEIGKELAWCFSSEKIDKILTIEASGIAPALGVTFTLDVPVLFAKKISTVHYDSRISIRS